MTTLLLLIIAVSPTQKPQAAAEPDAKQLAAWAADLSDKDFAKQNAARDALIKAGAKAAPIVPDLIKLLDEKNGKQLNWGMGHAVDILAAIGPDAKEALPALMA